MTIERFQLYTAALITAMAVAVNLWLVCHRRDTLNPMRLARALMAAPLCVIYTLGLYGVLDGRLNVIAARSLIVPVWLVLGILPSFLHARDDPPAIVVVPQDALERIEKAADRILG